MQVVLTGWLKRFIARQASESLINDMKDYQPERLVKLAQYLDNPPDNWPWDDKEKSQEFWKVYRRMVMDSANGKYACQ